MSSRPARPADSPLSEALVVFFFASVLLTSSSNSLYVFSQTLPLPPAWSGCSGTSYATGILEDRANSSRGRSIRLLLQGGLLLLILAGGLELAGWAASPFGDTPPSASELIALVTDPVRQRTQFLRRLAVASCLILACVCFGVAIGRLPRERLRRFGRAVPTVGVLTLVTLVFVAILPLGLTAGLLGSVTDVGMAALLVLGGYAWVVGREVRRHGTAPSIAALGATVLATAVWLVADDIWRSWPEPRDSDAIYVSTGVSVSVAVETGTAVGTRPDVGAAVVVALLLLGAALTVLACARLSMADSETR